MLSCLVSRLLAFFLPFFLSLSLSFLPCFLIFYLWANVPSLKRKGGGGGGGGGNPPVNARTRIMFLSLMYISCMLIIAVCMYLAMTWTSTLRSSTVS